MKLPFLDRDEETARLTRLVESREGSLGVLYGRRRCGKSRLLREVLPPERTIYYVGDEREGALQRTSLAAEIGRLLPGFDRVNYPDWDSLLARFWNAQATSILALIGQGCHRISEIAARLGKPVTSLARPLERLIEMDLVVRETPFGTSARTSKRTLYRIADPFLRYWFRFVQPD